jgi:1D-myo-inositol 3-kinase
VKHEVQFDYTTVGHVTADLMADGTRRPGGSAFYSALQASRLGQRALIITRGAVQEIEELLEPYRGEFELVIHPAPQTTTLETSVDGAVREQRVLAWAGPIAEELMIDTGILHLAPVARETPRRWAGHAELVGLTPQGLVRSWDRDGGKMGQVPLEPAQLPERWDAIVLNETELQSCPWLADDAAGSGEPDSRGAARAAGGVVAVTNAAAPTAIHRRGAAIARVEVPTIEEFRDDVGAGDVFAAAFFVALREGLAAPGAASFANAAAAVRIAGPGAGAIGRRGAIEARLRAAA